MFSFLNRPVGKRIVIFFICWCFFICFSSRVVFFHLLTADVLFSSSSSCEIGILHKKCPEKCYLLQQARLAVTRWCLWFDERLNIQGDFARIRNAMFFFSDLLYLPGPRDATTESLYKETTLSLALYGHSCWKRISKSPGLLSSQKNGGLSTKWISSSDLLAVLRFCCRNWSCKNNEANADWVSSESKYSL